jgi:hypothetical protein
MDIYKAITELQTDVSNFKLMMDFDNVDREKLSNNIIRKERKIDELIDSIPIAGMLQNL